MLSRVIAKNVRGVFLRHTVYIVEHCLLLVKDMRQYSVHQHWEVEDIMQSGMLHYGLWSSISLWEAAQDTRACQSCKK